MSETGKVGGRQARSLTLTFRPSQRKAAQMIKEWSSKKKTQNVTITAVVEIKNTWLDADTWRSHVEKAILKQVDRTPTDTITVTAETFQNTRLY